MGRMPGFTYFDPGVYSLTVPYHDVNDFFYSGHVGTCLLITLEYYSSKYYKMALFTLLILVNQWTMLSLVRTHYIIDLVTGVLFAHYFFIQAERASYVTDVLGMRIGDGKARMRHYWKACDICGFSQKYAGDYMGREEKMLMKNVDQERRALLGNNKTNKGLDPFEKVQEVREHKAYAKQYDEV